MKGRPSSQEYSHHHIMCSVWLENCLQRQQLWTCPAEFLEFNAAASVVTGHWLFLLPPQCSRGFVNYHLVQKCCLGQTKSDWYNSDPKLRLSHTPASGLLRACENTDLAVSPSEDFPRCHKVSDCPTIGRPFQT